MFDEKRLLIINLTILYYIIATSKLKYSIIHLSTTYNVIFLVNHLYNIFFVCFIYSNCRVSGRFILVQGIHIKIMFTTENNVLSTNFFRLFLCRHVI